MLQMLGEIKLFPYDDIPEDWIKCDGRSLHINKYPKLYMLIGMKFGKDGSLQFKLPDLTAFTPKDLTYCISVEGELPKIHGKRSML